jgi:hypothetical protein
MGKTQGSERGGEGGGWRFFMKDDSCCSVV